MGGASSKCTTCGKKIITPLNGQSNVFCGEKCFEAHKSSTQTTRACLSCQKQFDIPMKDTAHLPKSAEVSYCEECQSKK